MDRRAHPGKVLHGLGFVPDEADVACNLLQDIKKHSEYCVAKTVNPAKETKWHSMYRDIVCGPGEEVVNREKSVLSQKALAILSWINAIRDPLTLFGKEDMPFQPFQNMMVMDFLIYLIQRTCPTEIDEIIHQCKRTLSLPDVTTEEIRVIKERFSIKHSVYIIPRRHGKTSMFTALMATTVLFVDNIAIGYGCHRKMALKEAYKTTLDVMSNIKISCNLGAIRLVETLAGERIRVRNHETQKWSSILFVSLQNDKVMFIWFCLKITNKSFYSAFVGR